MDLRLYLFERRIKITEFSKTLGCSRMHLSGIVGGTRIPSKVLANLIEQMTKGLVTANELTQKQLNIRES